VTEKKRGSERIKSPAAEQVAGDIIAALHGEYDPARARAAQRYFTDEIVALGVTAPVVRGLVRTRMKPLMNLWGLGDAVKCCDLLLKEPEIEVRVAGVLVLGMFKRDFTLALTDHAYKWLQKRMDNWALVDSLSSLVLSPLLEKHPEVGATHASPLQTWSRDKCLWVRRAALVALVPLARHGKYLDLSYELARDHLGDSEDLMHKAIGWLLREAGRTDAPRLRQFLLRHGPAIPRTTLRYAIEHFPSRDRTELMNATRGDHRTQKRRENS
jgi:3-methyladenine DNA glycosylase AlkD